MKVQVNGQIATLSLVDPATGVNFVKDLIGNYNALNDGQFRLIEGSDIYECDADTFDWWAKVLNDQQELQDRIEELKEIHGVDAVDEALSRADECDLEDQAAAINKALDEAFPGN